MEPTDRARRLSRASSSEVLGAAARCGGMLERPAKLNPFPPPAASGCAWAARADGEGEAGARGGRLYASVHGVTGTWELRRRSVRAAVAWRCCASMEESCDGAARRPSPGS